MRDKNLCNAVDCNAISDHILKCMIELESGEEEIHTIKFCHDHYLRQKALEYHMEEHIRGERE